MPGEAGRSFGASWTVGALNQKGVAIITEGLTMTNFTHFYVADYLDNEETIAAYLTAALDDADPDAFLATVKAVCSCAWEGTVGKRFWFGARKSLQGALAWGEASLRKR